MNGRKFELAEEREEHAVFPRKRHVPKNTPCPLGTRPCPWTRSSQMEKVETGTGCVL